ncbi:SIR2 family protein [Streptomyces murinus]|uniref:SIR2 family protein n=1 Tax=Streptomyces murinus TaxID=33900 RepID=UPI00372C0305
MTVVRAKLATHLHRLSTPFLFVGSGLSRRYIGTEDWEGLLRRFASLTPRPYEFYKTSANGHLPTVASKIAEVFHEIWWEKEEFSASRRDWSSSLQGVESALKVEIAKHLSKMPSLDTLTEPLSTEITLLKQAVVDGIITTNYDPLLETTFPDFHTFAGQDELLFSTSQGIGEIYKIHGSYSAPDSLVLTAKDYANFEERNAYLAAKLMTIFVEHPVIFLGYSLGDQNVKMILQSIARCLTQDNIENLRDRLIFVQWEPSAEPSVDPYTIMMNDYPLSVLRVTVNDFVDVFAILSELKRSFPAKLLRRLKEQVYDLVLADDPHNRLVVADIDDKARSEDIEVVFGVGVHAKIGKQGYVGLTRWDIIEDVVDGKSEFEAGSIVTQVLPGLLKGSGNLPVYKYLAEYNALDESGNVKTDLVIDPRITSMAEKSKDGISTGESYKKNSSRFLDGVLGIADLLEKKGVDGVINYGVYLNPEIVSIDELRSFLETHKHLKDETWGATQYVKLTCFLDWLSYGRRNQKQPD